MKKLIFIFIASICLIENSNAATTITTTCIKAFKEGCYYDHYTTPDETCSDDACKLCKGETFGVVNNGVIQTLEKSFYENCPDQTGHYTCDCKIISTTNECAPGYYGTATSASTGCTKCPDNALCVGGNNSTFACKTGYKKNATGTICEKEGLTCSDNQFIYNGKCYDCPEHATCDGLEFACNNGFTPTTNACICRSDRFINNNQCTKCPANASCDGSENFSCNKSFYKTNNTCTQCPHYGTTDDKGATQLSECYLPPQQYVNDAGYFEIIEDDKKCNATNK